MEPMTWRQRAGRLLTLSMVVGAACVANEDGPTEITPPATTDVSPYLDTGRTQADDDVASFRASPVTTEDHDLTVVIKPPPPAATQLFTTTLLTPNGLCLDVKGDSTSPGTPLDVWSCNGTAAQLFTFWSDGVVTGPGGQCLDVWGDNAAGGRLDMTTCNGTAAQQWALRGQRLVATGARISGQAPLCLQTTNDPAPLNDAVTLNTCSYSQLGQKDMWTPLNLGSEIHGIGDNCIDVVNGSTQDGAALQIFTCNGAPGQTFHFTSNNEIVSGAGKCLDVNGANAKAGVLDMTTCNGTAAQKWSLQGRQIASALGGCLDALDGWPTPHTTLDLTTCNGTRAQQWFIPTNYTEGMATLLVIADDAMKPAADQLVAHKNATGLPAASITLEDLNSLYCDATQCNTTSNGVVEDKAAVVKHGIDYFYRYRGTQYVFLAGDATHVPMRYTPVIDQGTACNENANTVSWRSSDLYYANLYHHGGTSPDVANIGAGISSWNNGAKLQTGQGIYNLSTFATQSNGAPSGCNPSNVDGYPDVAVGRLDVSQPGDLANYVQKVTTYETQVMHYAQNATFLADSCYGGEAMLNSPSCPLSAEAGNGNAVQLSLDENDQIAGGLPSSMAKFWVAFNDQSPNVVPSPWSSVSITQEATAALNVSEAFAFSGLVTYVGHGGPGGWDAPTLGTGFFDGLTQPNIPLVFAAACQTGQYANMPALQNPLSPPPTPASFDALSNHMLAHATTGGAMSYAGETVVMPDDLGTDFITMNMQRYTAGERTLGDMWRQAQIMYWHKYFGNSPNDDSAPFAEPRNYLGIMALAGDPSLRMQRGQGPVH